jgi:pimeloyl-ACP methyl ester carboxylesterase
MTSELERLDKHRGQVHTRSGPASYIDTGGPGRPALFVHGVISSSYLWRHVIGQLEGQRRCVAIDLPLHGQTPADGQELTLPGLARFVADCCDALELTDIDLVANDTGGAIAQVFAAGHPERLHTLTLTNCETHDNMPPPALRAATLLARSGLPIWRFAPRLARDIARSRKRFYGKAYQDLASLPEDVARAWLEPVFGTPESARLSQRLMASLRARDLLAAEPALTRLQVPTLVVWGTGDMFFDRKWAYWLRDTIPGATEVVEIPGGRLFFPDERAAELTEALRRHWDAHP